jgi:hypothetical protein
MLGGAGWRGGGRARRAGTGDLRGDHAFFTPDAPGRWRLEDDAARAVPLQAAWHNTTLLDCGRADLPRVRSAGRDAESDESRARTALRPVRARLPRRRRARLARTEDFSTSPPGSTGNGSRAFSGSTCRRRCVDWAACCTSCHGPGAIPNQVRARRSWTATCAPFATTRPRYLHVEQWRDSRMARADARTRDAHPNARAATPRAAFSTRSVP